MLPLTAITHCDGPSALECLEAYCTQNHLKSLLTIIKDLCFEEEKFLDKTSIGVLLRNGVEWWIRPQQLKMLHKDYADKDIDTWKRYLTSTNAVEWRNRDCAKLHLLIHCFLH